MQATEVRFIETSGGVIVSKATGQEVARINVGGMLIDDAVRARRAIIAALEAEFAPRDTDTRVTIPPLPGWFHK